MVLAIFSIFIPLFHDRCKEFSNCGVRDGRGSGGDRIKGWTLGLADWPKVIPSCNSSLPASTIGWPTTPLPNKCMQWEWQSNQWPQRQEQAGHRGIGNIGAPPQCKGQPWVRGGEPMGWGNGGCWAFVQLKHCPHIGPHMAQLVVACCNIGLCTRLPACLL